MSGRQLPRGLAGQLQSRCVFFSPPLCIDSRFQSPCPVFWNRTRPEIICKTFGMPNLIFFATKGKHCLGRFIENIEGPPFSALPISCSSTRAWGTLSQPGISHQPAASTLSLEILGEVCPLVPLRLAAPGGSSLFVSRASGWFSYTRAHPWQRELFPCTIRNPPNGKLVRCAHLGRAPV